MEAANTAPGSQGPLHPNCGRPLRARSPPARRRDEGRLPLIPRPRRCCTHRAEHPPRRGALPPRAEVMPRRVIQTWHRLCSRFRASPSPNGSQAHWDRDASAAQGLTPSLPAWQEPQSRSHASC